VKATGFSARSRSSLWSSDPFVRRTDIACPSPLRVSLESANRRRSSGPRQGVLETRPGRLSRPGFRADQSTRRLVQWSLFGARLLKVISARPRASLARPSRSKARRILGVESLERRALLANITASGVISSTPDGAHFDYSITLSNSREARWISSSRVPTRLRRSMATRRFTPVRRWELRLFTRRYHSAMPAINSS